MYATAVLKTKASDQENHMGSGTVFNFMQPILTGLFGTDSQDQLQHLKSNIDILGDRSELLTHWDRDKMVAFFQTTFSNAFSSMKM